MNTKFASRGLTGLVLCVLSILLLGNTAFAVSGLQGQDKGDTNTWSSVNLQGWQELDYIPFRIAFDSSSAGLHTVTLDFPHLIGTTPGFEDLTGFSLFTTNISFTSAPVLTTDPAGIWRYTFTVSIAGNNAAEVRFFARLAAGAHLNPGSSLHLTSNYGLVQIYKPAAGPGLPDLAIVKSGNATVFPGGLLSYTLIYTNKALTNTAVGAQICDILPTNITVVVSSLAAGAHLVGNTIFWDLTNLLPHANGTLTFQANASFAAPVGSVLTNFAEVLSSENDLNMADNTSVWLTTVAQSCVPPSIGAGPGSNIVCSGQAVTLSVTAAGSSPIQYQWRKDGTAIPGATKSSFSIVTATATDAGNYSVGITNSCGFTNSAPALLTVNQTLSIVRGPINATNCSGSTAMFQIQANGTGLQFQWYRGLDLILNSTNTSLVLSNVTVDSSDTYSVVVNGTCGGCVTNSATLTVTSAPSIVCPSSKTVQYGSSWGFDLPSANYPIVVISTLTNVAGHCGNTFDATRTWAAIDACGNSSQCSQTVNVVDTTAPVINCGSTNKTVQLGTGWTFDTPTATDISSNVTITILSTVTNTVGHCGNTFDATRTWAAIDACGNSSQCSQTVNVVDTTAPVINCASTNKTIQLGAAWTFDAPTATDISSNVTITILSTVTNTSGHCGNTFDATRTWAAIDGCGNSSSCSQTVNVVDTIAPVINCGSTNKTVQLGTAWTFDAPTATDTSSNVPITILSTVTNTAGHCGNTFDATRTWAAIDACGNSSSCSQTVNVVDTIAPVINCGSTNKTVQLGTAWTFDAPTATDISSNVTITILSTVTNTVGHCGNTFDAILTWAAIDACGNSAQCSQTVNVIDTIAPVINCASTNKTVQLGMAWTFDAPTATDISSNLTITVLNTVTNTAGHCGNTFDATRTWAAIDACGNSSQCSQTVNIVDTTAPVINCASTNKTIQFGTTWTFDAPTATDISSNVTITILSTVTNTVGHCGNTFDAILTWAAIDACGNSAQCSQTVNVIDTIAPVINCASTNKTVQLGMAWTFDAPTATDISSNLTITVLNTVTNTAGHCGNTFDATRTWAAIDACGNSSQCSQTVNIVDTTAPVINCASTNKTIQFGTTWTFDAPTATDISSNVTITILSTVTNTAGHCGNTFDATRTWAAIDGCGNSSQCNQTVNIVDTTAPVINCGSTNKTVQFGTGWMFDAPTATDISSNVTITILSTVTNTAGHCGNTFDATRTWAAIDGCGNSSQCNQTVNIVDTTAPVINCGSTNKTVQFGTGWMFDAPTATDISSNVTITILSTVTNTVGHCGSTFDATRTWAAIDACGNSSQCSQTVNIVDTTAPVINCASTNKTIQLGAAWTFDAPTAADISSNVTITVLNTVTNTAGHCGSTFDATRTWAAIDACGNSSQCSQTVNIVNTTAPVINCASTNKTVQLGTAWTFDAPSASGMNSNVTITILSTVTNTVGYCGKSFDATRTWAAIDGCGNSSQCSQTVVVVDRNPIHISAAPLNQTNCSGTVVSFNLSATGTSLTYNWQFAGKVIGTGITLNLGAVSTTNSGLYIVVVSDQCGNSVTNSAFLQVRAPTAASPLAGAMKSPGDSVTFSTTATGVGPFTYAWKKDNQFIAGENRNTLTRTNLTFADAGVYTVLITGTCNTDSQSATLVINHPPTVAIISPTNGAVFVAPASFTLAANATDSDGVVTNVEFYLFNTNKLVETTNSTPAVTIMTNLPVGGYTFTAAAADNFGARGTSAPVSITILSEPPLTIVSSIRLNLQTGLYDQTVRVSNPTYNSFNAIRVYIGNLNNGTTVYNATGTTNGLAYVESHAVIPAGGYADFVIEYYVPSRILPNPILHAELVAPAQGAGTTALGTQQHIDRGLMLADRTFLVEFLTLSNRLYSVQYSSDLKIWKDAQPAITGNGTRIQWIDNGEPKTESAPSITANRFYRVVLLP